MHVMLRNGLLRNSFRPLQAANVVDRLTIKVPTTTTQAGCLTCHFNRQDDDVSPHQPYSRHGGYQLTFGQFEG